MASAYRKVSKALRKAGFALKRDKKHEIWECPCGNPVILPKGLHDGGSGFKNYLKTFRSACPKHTPDL